MEIIILSIICTLSVVSNIILAVRLFGERFTIVDLETYNELARVYNKKMKDEENNCGGGVGFHVYMSDDEDYDEEEDKKNA